jgi:hypothetical protein
MDRTCPRPAAWRLATVGFAFCLSALGFFACGDEPMLEPELVSQPNDTDPGHVQPSAGSAVLHRHKLIVPLEMIDFEQPGRLARVTQGFDAFLYGHLDHYESQVQGLERQGLESFRYFNVFHTDPLYPTWGGYYAQTHAYLASHNGWIPGVAYPWFSNPDNPDRIIDHTRGPITGNVAGIIRHWADRVGADKIFLDLTYDRLEDWMIRPGDHWPWPPSQHGAMNVEWLRNMRRLVRDAGESGRVVVNGSADLSAAGVFYENQVWNDRRGYRSWDDVMRRIRNESTVPILHVGHHHLGSGDAWMGEMLVAAIWLLADDSYLLVEPEGRPMLWAQQIKARGYQRFVATEPIRELTPGFLSRRGTIDGAPYRVEVDLVRRVGRVFPTTP